MAFPSQAQQAAPDEPEAPLPFPVQPADPKLPPVQPPPPPPPPAPKPRGPDQKDVDAAIDRGCAWLLAQAAKGPGRIDMAHGQCSDAQVLYTLVKGGADRNHAAFQALLQRCLTEKIERTYWASTLAMALEALDADTYQPFIKNCGQYLVDTQCPNGQWWYGREVPLKTPTLSTPPKRTESPGGAPGAPPSGGNTAPRKKLVVLPRSMPIQRDFGDNSNSQYAVLGLRACEMAGVDIPRTTWDKSRKWWVKDQQKDGGWNYWDRNEEHSYPSMTEGAAGSLVICLHMLGESWALNENVKKGLAWIEQNSKIRENAIQRHGDKTAFLYYHLYAIERAAAVSNSEFFGQLDWYPEGAKYLLKRQDKDGSWEGEGDMGHRIHDTCFAILFLKRATKTLSDPNAAAKPGGR